ncbi:MAG: hypothetical protein QXQ57_06465 [Sulfolobales archaeon]
MNSKPIHIAEGSNAYSSSRDPFSRKPIKRYIPSMIRVALRGGRRVKVIKIEMRLTRLSNGLILDRDIIGAINISLKYLSSNGSPMALGSTGLHEVCESSESTPRANPNHRNKTREKTIKA